MRETTKPGEAVARAFIGAVPHARELGFEIDCTGAGEVELVMPWREDLVGDPVSGVLHGGAVFTLMDTASGAAVLSHPQVKGPTATLGLRIDYMRAATPGQAIRVCAECHHVTRTVAFVRATAFDDDRAHPVAMATGSFTLGGDAS